VYYRTSHRKRNCTAGFGDSLAIAGYDEGMNARPDHTGIIRSYILRVWREEDAAACAWRASLTAIPGGERIGFTDLEQLLKYLQAGRPAAAQRSPDDDAKPS
jgi:hypothetical protein